MSAKVSGAVWEAKLPQPEKYVLLALADHADHNGGNVRPSIGLTSWKTGYSERQVRRIVRLLEERRILIAETPATGGRARTTHYRIDLSALPKLPPRKPGQDDPLSIPGHHDRLSDKPGHSVPPNPDIAVSQNPDTAMSAESSRTVKEEPSGKGAIQTQRAIETPWPDGWTYGPDEERIAVAAGLTKEEGAIEFERFAAKADAKDWRYAKWPAAFRTWCLNEVKWRKERPPSPTPSPAGKPDGWRYWTPGQRQAWLNRGGQGKVVE